MNEQEYILAEQNLGLLTSGAIALIVAGMIIAFGAQVTNEVADDVATCDAGFAYHPSNNTCENATDSTSLAFNGSQNSLSGMGKLAAKLPTVGLVIGAEYLGNNPYTQYRDYRLACCRF